MTGYTTLDAYEQFCENYENYANIPLIVNGVAGLTPYAGLATAGGVLTGVPMAIKNKLTKNALEEAAQENLLKGGLAGAGLIGAGVIGTKLAKKLLKKKKKKPFNSPSFSEEYYDYFSEPKRSLLANAQAIRDNDAKMEAQAALDNETKNNGRQSFRKRINKITERMKEKAAANKEARAAAAAADRAKKAERRDNLNSMAIDAVVSGKYEKPSDFFRHAGHQVGKEMSAAGNNIADNFGRIVRGFKQSPRK